MTLPSVLFIPESHYDYRIWTDIPSSLSDRCHVVHYDQHAPMSSAVVDDPVFLDTVRRLAPTSGFDAVITGGSAARLAFKVAVAGLARTVLFFQPAPDSHLEDAGATLSVEELEVAASRFSLIAEALSETTLGKRKELVVETWRQIYGPYLEAEDLELACRVIGDHAEDLLATSKEVTAAAEAGRDIPWPSPPWVDRLDEIAMPMTVIMSKPANRTGQAIARRIGQGRLIVSEAQTDLVWLEDRQTALVSITQLLGRLSGAEPPRLSSEKQNES